jgi:hypothetical protein
MYFIVNSNIKEIFNLRKVEKLRSAEVVLIGKAARILSNELIVGYIISEHSSNA